MLAYWFMLLLLVCVCYFFFLGGCSMVPISTQETTPTTTAWNQCLSSPPRYVAEATSPRWPLPFLLWLTERDIRPQTSW